jgi:hypothetical protein
MYGRKAVHSKRIFSEATRKAKMLVFWGGVRDGTAISIYRYASLGFETWDVLASLHS